MTYREVLQEVCRLVRPSLLPPRSAESIRLLWHQCSAPVMSDSRYCSAYHACGCHHCATVSLHCISRCEQYLPVPQANWLKSEGVRKGDAVAIYLPLICELPSARPPIPTQHVQCLGWRRMSRTYRIPWCIAMSGLLYMHVLAGHHLCAHLC